MLLFSVIPVPYGLTRAGLYSAGIILSAIVLWVTEALPICITAIGLCVLMPLFHVLEYSDVMSGFGTGTALFIMATSGITIVLTKTTIPL